MRCTTAIPRNTERGSASKLAGKHQKLRKKLTGQGITAIERIMAARAAATGKLTIMKSVAKQATAAQKAKPAHKPAGARRSKKSGGGGGGGGNGKSKK